MEADPLLGSQLGAYRVEALIGIGGMGRVYKAVQPKIGSRVAIKVLSRECSDRRDLVERFFAEAKAVNVVSHENIVNVLDLATLPDGRPYIVMEYLDGAPLSSVIAQAQGPLPIGSIARLCVEVLDGLAAAHAKGIIHRDLKPDNIFVSPTGRGKVLDFGIAKLQPELSGISTATHTGSLLGTPHYMSPEQAAGRVVDARADLYAMGVILFECLTQQKPFSADSLFDLLKKHIEVPPPMPRALRPDIPADLEQVILLALAKSPEQRWTSAKAMSAALQHSTQNLPAEQWAPLQPTSLPSRPGWNPTPPASWAASSQKRSEATAPTQTSGQAATQHHGKSLGPWIALAALILVGGGITAVVLATNNQKDPAKQPAPVTTPEPTIVPVVIPDPLVKGDNDGDTDSDTDLEDITDSDMIEQALGNAHLPPKVQAAIKKYGSWKKIPRKERAALAPLLLGAMTDQLNDVLDGVPGTSPVVPPKKVEPKPPHAENEMALPPSWSPSRVPIQSTLSYAMTKAKAFRSDAQLTRIDVSNIYRDGHADLTLPDGHEKTGMIWLRFRASEPCAFWIQISPTRAELRPMTDACKDIPISGPHCTIDQMWTRLLAVVPGADAHPVDAILKVNPSSKTSRWYIGNQLFDDDCDSKHKNKD